jgi:hypothetical protein
MNPRLLYGIRSSLELAVVAPVTLPIKPESD